MAAPPDDDRYYPRPGEILDDKYEIQRVLGTGAMGAVIRATHKLRKAPVALKFMSPKVVGRRGVVERFLNEGVAASQIDSDHVVKVLDVSKLPSGIPYLVMEYLEGEDLRELLRREGSPGLADVPRSVHFVLQILRGLQVAHRVGIVHRDMKPANCFVVHKDGEPDFVKIVDFGISKVQTDDGVELTQDGSALGTPLYMSPEQARSPKDVDARSDLYGAAAILYELLSGRPPFVPESGTLSELFIMLGTEEPTSLEETRSDLPSGLWEVVHRGLAKDPNDRYANAAAMAEALAPFADERSQHVLRQILQRAYTGESRFPPPPGPPTHVDAEPATPEPAPQAPAGTIVIDEPAPATGEPAHATAHTIDEPSRPRRALWVAAALGVAAVAVAIGIGLQGDGNAPVSATDPVADGAASAAVPETPAPTARPSASSAEPGGEPASSAAASAPPVPPAPPLTGSSPPRPPPAPTDKPRLKTITIQD